MQGRDVVVRGLTAAALVLASGSSVALATGPVRPLALTGTEHGPELKKLLPLVGREKAKARLEGQTA